MNKRRNWLSGAISMLIGISCALVLGFVFYGAMAYQLADGTSAAVQDVSFKEAGAQLALADAHLISEQTTQTEYDGQLCSVTTRQYRTDTGIQAQAISASPAAYIARLSQESWTPQLITGFSLAGLDAVYSVRGTQGMLAAREGEWIYMLSAEADDQTLYALGAHAYLE